MILRYEKTFGYQVSPKFFLYLLDRYLTSLAAGVHRIGSTLICAF